mgnify:FL=1
MNLALDILSITGNHIIIGKETANMENKERKTIIIFTASKARELLKAGFQIIDLKPDCKDKTHMRSVFVFQYDEKIQQYLKEM